MDLLAILKTRIELLITGEHALGLRSVLQHIQVAVRHLARGAESGDDTAYTDAIYRTNQAFEGSLKEAYRVLANRDPLRVRPYDIERYFQENKILRARVIDQMTTYRTLWRNPSTHDYKLDFDEDEALLAIVSVAAFTIMLTDQISEKLNFDRAKAEAPATPIIESEKRSLRYAIADVLQEISKAESIQVMSGRETAIIGYVAGYLQKTIKNADIRTEVEIGDAANLRPDMIVTRGDEKVIIEVKRGSAASEQNIANSMVQVMNYMNVSGIKEAILFISPLLGISHIREEYVSDGTNAKITLLRPTKKGTQL